MNAKIKCYQGLRGIAFLLVFISHCAFSEINSGISTTTYFGAFGVSVFIILSGFLTVFNHYFDDELSVKKQISKTLKKCYPLHFLTFLLAFPFVLKELFKPNIDTWIGSFLNILLVQSWVPKKSIYFLNNAVSWYLSTYLFFMLISPFVVRWLKRLNSKDIIGLLLLVLTIQIALVLLAGNHTWAHWIIYIFPISRALDFISGGGIAMLLKRINIQKRLYCILLLFGITVSVCLLFITTKKLVGNTFLTAIWSLPVYAITMGLFGCEKNNIVRVLFQNNFILHIGNVSLELFIIHQLVIRYVEVIARKQNFLSSFKYVIAFLITIMVATVLHEFMTRRTSRR